MATVVLLAVYLGGTFLFGGVAGLLIGAAAVVAHLASGRRTGPLWAAAVACMAAVPVALMAQGLPGDDVVGPRFAEEHWLAHLLTAASLAVAGLAVLVEVVTPGRVAPPPTRSPAPAPAPDRGEGPGDGPGA